MSETNAYLVGLSESEILCYDEQRDYRASQCYHFSGDSVFWERYTKSEADEMASDEGTLVELKPELKGRLHVYFWQVRSTVSLMD